MSANTNITTPQRPKRVALVAANPAVSPVTGWPVGFWYAELTHPWWAFHEAGYEVELFSPDGGAVEADGWSDPEHESGYAADDILSLGFKKSPTTAALLEETKALDALDPSAFDAVFFAGGQSPMVTFVENPKVHGAIRTFHAAGKVVALVCHATAALLKATDDDGELIVKGKQWTGFADAEEAYAEEAVGQKIQPFWIETEARKLEGTEFTVAAPGRPHAIRDGQLITGQQQFSGAAAAALVIEAVGR
jgi:putative intracellular protease/amidase